MNVKNLVEAILLAAGRPLEVKEIAELFDVAERPECSDLEAILQDLIVDSENRGVSLVKLATGYQYQTKASYAPIVSRLWQEKPQKYSRALLETLALIAYRQPITRGEIEEIRGVSISSSVFKTLQEERGWIRVVGYKDVPGKPGLYATTKEFLTYFGLTKLEELPSLPQLSGLTQVTHHE